MRTYVGFYDELERRQNVVIVDGVEPPTPDEIVAFLDELAEVSRIHHLGRPSDPERRARALENKRQLVDRIRASQAPPTSRELPSAGGPGARFSWGHNMDGTAELAEAILHRELAIDVPAPVYVRFRDEVVTWLAVDGFRLPASDVWEWLQANRALVNRHVSGLEPEQPVLAVIGKDEAPPKAASGGSLDGPLASRLVDACEGAWTDIRAIHPDLPEVVIVLGTGVERGRLVKLGHWWGGRWIADGETRGEVLLAGEALHLGPRQVFEVLLHEAAHGINAARGIKDTSRGGRYHNERFAETAREVGLTVRPMPPYGMAHTELTDAGADRYAASIERIADTMRIARQLRGIKGVGAGIDREIGGSAGGGGQPGVRKQSRNAPSATCGCGRRMRMSPTALAKGPVVCGLCGGEFTTNAEVRPTPQRGAERAYDATVDNTFEQRRREAVRAEHDEELRTRLIADRDRIDRASDGPRRPLDGSVIPLSRRREDIDGALIGLGAEPAPPRVETTDQRLRRWYEMFGTVHEQPMAARPDEIDELQRRARSLLRDNGVLRGPDLDLGSLHVAIGDRLVVRRDVLEGPPAGTLGTVVLVDRAGQVASVDFATWGDLDVKADSDQAAALDHDYAILAPARRATTEAVVELERHEAPVLEPGP